VTEVGAIEVTVGAGVEVPLPLPPVLPPPLPPELLEEPPPPQPAMNTGIPRPRNKKVLIFMRGLLYGGIFL
jgi:hypothetical protein